MLKMLIGAAAVALLATPAAFAQQSGGGAITGAAGGAATGAIVGGPVGAIIGGVAGATFGAALEAPPPPHVQTYVTEHPADPVVLEGELVVGATLPDVVVLHPVPEYEYHYTVVNDRRILVEPQTRQVVYVFD